MHATFTSAVSNNRRKYFIVSCLSGKLGEGCKHTHTKLNWGKYQRLEINSNQIKQIYLTGILLHCNNITSILKIGPVVFSLKPFPTFIFIKCKGTNGIFECNPNANHGAQFLNIIIRVS